MGRLTILALALLVAATAPGQEKMTPAPSSPTVDELTQAIEQDPTDPRAHFDRASYWLANHRAKNALQDLAEAIRLDPNEPQFYLSRAQLWNRLAQFDKAVADCNEIVRLAPAHPSGYLTRSLAWYYKREHRKAIADLDEVVRLMPDKPVGYLRRAESRAAIGEVTRASDDYARAIECEPDLGLLYRSRGHFHLALKRYEDAVKDLDSAIRLAIAKPSADDALSLSYFDRGQAKQKLGDVDGALDDFNAALKLDSNIVDFCEARANLWAEREEYARAVKDIDEVQRIRPESMTGALYRLRGTMQHERREYARALEDFQAAIRLDVGDGVAYYCLARLYATCPDDHVRDGKKAQENAAAANFWLGGDSAVALDMAAAVAAELGDFPKAVELQTRALKAAAEDRKADYESRLELYKTGKPYRYPPQK